MKTNSYGVINAEDNAPDYEKENKEVRRATTFVPLGITLIIFAVWLIVKIADEKTQAPIDGLLGFFTLLVIMVQSFIIQRQWQAMQDALKRTDAIIQQTKDHFEIAERPFIGVEKIRLFESKEGEAGCVVATIRNSGKMPATEVEMFLTPNFYYPHELSDDRCPDPYEEGGAVGLISCGVLQSNATNELLSVELPYEPVFRMLKSGEVYTMVWVRIRYKNIAGKPFETEYFARHNVKTGAITCGKEHNRAT